MGTGTSTQDITTNVPNKTTKQNNKKHQRSNTISNLPRLNGTFLRSVSNPETKLKLKTKKMKMEQVGLLTLIDKDAKKTMTVIDKSITKESESDDINTKHNNNNIKSNNNNNNNNNGCNYKLNNNNNKSKHRHYPSAMLGFKKDDIFRNYGRHSISYKPSKKHSFKTVETEKRKILLLGNGNSGKSTIFRQLSLIFNKNKKFDDSELFEARNAIRQNCLSTMIQMIQKSHALYNMDPIYFKRCHLNVSNIVINTDTNQIEIEYHSDSDTKINSDPSNNSDINNEKAIIKCITNIVNFRTESFEEINDDILNELGSSLLYLWKLDVIKNVFEFRFNRFNIPDNMEYFYNKTKEIFNKQYIPSIEDMLKLRIRTTGMIERGFTVIHQPKQYSIPERYKFNIHDTGGERNERKKWIHSFENVDSVIFVSALNQYAQVLWEDEQTIALHDSIELFSEISNGKWFKKSCIILFLNKNDLFRQLLYDGISLSICFNNKKTINNINNNNALPSIHIKTTNKNGNITPTPSPEPPEIPSKVPTPINNDNNNNNISYNDIDDDTKMDTNNVVNGTNINDNNVSTIDTNDDDNIKYYKMYNDINKFSTHAWKGESWNGTDFKYDKNKTVNENNIIFEKCYLESLEFIKKLFLKQHKDTNNTVHVHVTTATNKDNIYKTFEEIQKIIIYNNKREQLN